MSIVRFRQSAVALGALCAGALFAGPAMAGRCGGAYPVDAPTTLTKVARACNVSLKALIEANPGVDPDYVSPGEHLAVPDEAPLHSDAVPTVADGGDVAEQDDWRPRYVEWTGDEAVPATDAAAVTTVNAVAPAAGSDQFYFYGASVANGFVPHTDESGHLSYQKRAAERIRVAGLPVNRPLLAPVAPEFVSATPGDGVAALMECMVLRRADDGKIKQVREFKPIPEGRETPSHCAAVRMQAVSATQAPALLDLKGGASLFARVYAKPGAPVPGAEAGMFSGYVSAANGECLTVIGDDGRFARIDARGQSAGLVGRDVRLWTVEDAASACGGLALDHAVYAEPVPALSAAIGE